MSLYDAFLKTLLALVMTVMIFCSGLCLEVEEASSMSAAEAIALLNEGSARYVSAKGLRRTTVTSFRA